jgi:type I restriction-modification system DNA methylase subunit
MAGIYDFDANALEAEIKKFGLKKTWLRILVTHLSGKNQFSYILENSVFKGIKCRESNLIANLSIGEIGVLYEYSVAIADSESRKSNGQFFTPDDVAFYMAEQAKSFEEGVWLDPCSGIGNLSWHLTAIQENPEEFLRNSLILSDRTSLHS